MSNAAFGCTGSGALLVKRCRVPNLSSAVTDKVGDYSACATTEAGALFQRVARVGGVGGDCAHIDKGGRGSLVEEDDDELRRSRRLYIFARCRLSDRPIHVSAWYRRLVRSFVHSSCLWNYSHTHTHTQTHNLTSSYFTTHETQNMYKSCWHEF